MTLVLGHSEIVKLLDMAEVIDAVEAAHRSLATGQAWQPERYAVSLPASSSVLVPMIATAGHPPVTGIKLLTDTPDNAPHGLPVQQSLIVLIDPVTGCHEAVLHGGAITRCRTAAASAVATRHLARPQGTTVGLVGAGALARTHLEALAHIRPISDVLVWSRTSETAKTFVAEMEPLGINLQVAATAEEAVREADIVCTLTPSRTPHVKGDWFRPGQHINAVGAPPRRDHREIDTWGIRRSRVIVDSRDVAHAESGDVMIPVAEGAIDPHHFATELGEVIAGAAAGRRTDEDVTLFNSVGLGIQDVVTAQLVVDRARAEGFGFDLALTQ